MSKFRALLVSTLLATALAGGTLAASSTVEAGKSTKAPVSQRDGSLWCC